jgi:hypothetical protein
MDDKKTDRAEDLEARLHGAEAFSRALLAGYHALRSYGVDFMSLPEWKQMDELEDAKRLKPKHMAEKVVNFCSRLQNAIKAAINRKQNIRLHTDNTKGSDPTTKH